MNINKNWEISIISKKSDLHFFKTYPDTYINSLQLCISIFPININQTESLYEISILSPSKSKDLIELSLGKDNM